MTNNGPVKIYFRKNVLLFALMLLLFLFLCLKQSFGQVAKPTHATLKNSVSVCLSLYGPELFGGYLNYYASERVSLNVGIGIFLDVHAGMNYYFTKRESRGSSLYAGFQATRIRKYSWSVFGSTQNPPVQLGLFLPIGYEYVGKKGFVLQLEVGPNIVSDQWSGNENKLGLNTFPVMISLKIGGIID